ncbi:MAG: polysulfide reductase NrfD [Chloroflexi bacterium]|nr:polysulfide reductase NrfD [Chloroflexota bacterium]
MKRGITLAYWVVLGVTILIGALALVVRALDGLKVTNLTQIVPWGLWVALYIYFIGLSAGSFLLSTLIYVGGVKRFEPVGKIAMFTAFVALMAGLLFILLDLGHMERFWTVFFNRNPNSVLEWEIHFYLLYMVILVAELWLLMRRDLVRWSQEKKGWLGTLYRLMALNSRDISEKALQDDMRLVKLLGLIGIPVAIGVHGGTGAIFAVVKARPYWYTGLFPLIFITSALASGGALLTFIVAFFSQLEEKARGELVGGLGKLVAALLGVDLLFIASEFLIGIYGAIPDHLATYNTIMFGPFWWVFWILQLGIGAALPLILLTHKRTNSNITWIGLAGAMIVVGIVGVRLNIVIPPLTRPLVEGFDTAYIPFTAAASLSALPATLDQILSYITWAGGLILLVALGALILFAAQKLGASIGQPAFYAAGIVAVVVIVFLAIRVVGAPGVSLAVNGGTAWSGYADMFAQTDSARQNGLYFPTLIEWLTSAGVIAFCVALFSIGKALLPLETKELSAEEMERARKSPWLARTEVNK